MWTTTTTSPPYQFPVLLYKQSRAFMCKILNQYWLQIGLLADLNPLPPSPTTTSKPIIEIAIFQGDDSSNIKFVYLAAITGSTISIYIKGTIPAAMYQRYFGTPTLTNQEISPNLPDKLFSSSSSCYSSLCYPRLTHSITHFCMCFVFMLEVNTDLIPT